MRDAHERFHGAVEAGHERPLTTIFGSAKVTRFAYRRRGEENLYLQDAALNLPTEVHSHGRHLGRLAGLNRGDVHRLRLPAGRGHEQRGPRYAVIVQADELLGLSTTLVAPTSRSAAPATFRPEIDLAGGVTRVLVEQLRAVDLQRLGQHVGRLAPDVQGAIDDALELALGL